MRLNRLLIYLIIIGIIGMNFFIINGVADSDLQVSFSTNPTIVTPGTNGYLEVTLSGIGTIYDIDISASSWDPAAIIPQGNWKTSISVLKSGESEPLIYEFKVSEKAQPELYQVVFNIEYSSGDTVKKTAIIKVENSKVLDIVSVSPSFIDIGKLSTLVFNISNNCGGDIENLLFEWEDPNSLIFPVGSDNRIIIPSVKAYNFTEVPIDIVANPSATPGVYPLTINIEYYDLTGTEQIITSTVGLQIGGTTDFEITTQQSTAGTTTFAITNIGVNVASSVIVSIPQQQNYASSGSSSVSLGNLDAGDYTLASFQISSTNLNDTQRPSFGELPGEMPSNFTFGNREGFGNREEFMNRSFGGMGENGNFILQVSYTDLFGIRQVVEKEVTLNTMSQTLSSTETAGDFSSRFGDGSGFSGQNSQQSENGTTYIVVGIIGIIVIVVILKLGKSKKLPKLNFSKIIKKGKNE